MQDRPNPDEILSIVSEFIRDDILPNLTGRSAFHARVAVSALNLLERQYKFAPESEQEELSRLRAILASPDGDLASLNAQLAEHLHAGDMTLETPDIRAHLWRTTLDKLAVDQPKYASYVRSLEELQALDGDSDGF